MADTAYLKKKHNTWTVVVEVPKHLRAKAGVARFKQSLKTDSLALANRVKHSYVAEFKQRIARLEADHASPLEALFRDADEWKEALSLASRTPSDDRFEAVEYDELLSEVKDRARNIEETQDRETAQRFLKAATGTGTLLKDLYPTWTDHEVVAVEQTKVQHRAAVRRYLDWAGEFATTEETDRKKAGAYVSHLIQTSGLSRTTIKRHLSSLSQLWQWLQSKGHVEQEANPWLRHKVGSKSKKKTRASLSNEMLLKLLRGSYSTLKFRQVLHDLIRLALLHGARLDELCAAKRTHVHKRDDGYWLSITDGKTDAAVREIPVHKLAAPIIERRLKDKDEYLFKGLTPGGPDNKRMWYVSKAYGRFRNQPEVAVKERWQDFHALRHTFAEMMEGQEVPESTVKLIVGHKRTSMTYGHYSTGKRVELRKAIERLDYGQAVMDALAAQNG